MQLSRHTQSLQQIFNSKRQEKKNRINSKKPEEENIKKKRENSRNKDMETNKDINLWF